MSFIRAAARLAPPSLLRWVGRLQFQVPMLAPLINFAAAKVRKGESVIRHGVGAGLKFDPCGGHPGYAMGTTEPQEQQMLAAHLKAGQVFYDIGANVGFFTTLAAKLVGNRGQVYGFEPFPDCAEAARNNARRNGFDQVTIRQAAVSKYEGMGSFALKGTISMFHLASEAEKATAKLSMIQVPVVTIDGMVSRGELRPPDYVIIDVEGAELDVLEGMQNTIKTHRPAILCEVHWISAADFLNRIAAILGTDLYRIRTIDDQPLPTGIERYHVLMTPNR
jgi:FkbM family methyltransferase